MAWSSFSTGTHPARHNIFDFLDRDRRTYLPLLSSTRIGKVERFLKLGKYLIPRERPALTNLRRSKPFWTILGERRIWSTILRVPITFPPDRFYGAELSAMCVPDLLGTQGTFLLFTTRPPAARFKEGGQRVQVDVAGDRIDTVVTGPENGFVVGHPPLTCPLTLVLDRAAGARHGHRRRDHRHARRRRAQRLADAALPGGARRHGVGHRARAGARDGRARLALHVADQPRPRGTGDADLASRLLRRLPGQAPRAVRHARPRRGHLGAQRRRHRRRHVPAAGTRHRRRAARGCS